MQVPEQTSLPEQPAEEHTFPVIGIGASAGGLNAFKRLLNAIPEKSGMAFVVVQHLDASHESALPEILSKVTKIPVLEITDEIKLEPNFIYVIPSNKTLTSTDGILKLTPRTNPNLVIDVFFKSLAEVHHSFAVGIVLSGTGVDGTLGLKYIKAHGGITFAQDEASSAYDGMPNNAVAANVVDFILAPEEIPEQLMKINRVSSPHYMDRHAVLNKDEEETLKQILSILKLRSGVDFTYYKQSTIRRRLARRMAMLKKETLPVYLELLQSDETEQIALFHDVLIPVTAFFRDPKTYDALGETLFPSILKNKSASEPIRIWSAACSTGEEVYSLAICIDEFLRATSIERQVQVFGSDISESAISKARAGVYTKTDLEGVSDKRLETYFIKIDGSFQVDRHIRDMCVFTAHNFLKDPPFAKMDLISCRNVLIYMDPFLQKKALATFHYALKEHGFLLLGKCETAGTDSDLFSPFIKPSRIYSRKAGIGRFTPVTAEKREIALAKIDKKISRIDLPQTDFRKNAEAILTAKYTPANVIVNELLDIVHISGSISIFLEPSQGKPNFNLIKMARGSLGFELRSAVNKAKTTQTAVIKEGIPVENGDRSYSVCIEVLPLVNTVEPYYLIIFRKLIKPAADTLKEENSEEEELRKKNEFHLRIGQLEKELAQAREDMFSITEEQDAVNAELQGANEELLSGSEELQSLNEELETTKEEVQSSNEELIVVNQELLDKQEQLNRARLYAEAIVETIREPLVILDRDLRIKTAYSAFYKKFNLKEKETEGQLFYEIADGQWNDPFLISMLKNIVPKKTKLDDFEVALDFPSIGRCTMLLNARWILNETSDEDLILLAIEDISEKKIADQKRKTFKKDLELKVKEKTSSLEQSNLQLEQFSHTASHEFQEPLRKIVMFSKLLQQKEKKVAPELVQTYLNKIEAASIRMTTIIEDMLNFANSMSYEKTFVKTDLNTVLKNLLFDFELLIAEKDARVIFHDLPEIEAIPFQMNQLFYDLINNALKFSRKDIQPVIDISGRELSPKELLLHSDLNQDTTHFELIFKDNGIGFNQKYADKIFSMFQRLSTGGNYAGTGIGLAICKKIVKSYHGKIYAEGVENEGAVFHVILPAQQSSFASETYAEQTRASR